MVDIVNFDPDVSFLTNISATVKLILKVLKMKYKEQTGGPTDSIQLRHKRTNTRLFFLNEFKSPGKKLG